ncbi:hypothetical protein BH20VER1_BH20VER1_17170 [soil metagenome]
MKISHSTSAVALAMALFSTATFSHAQLVRSGAGAGATAARDQFRTDVGGGTTAGPNGSFGGVRREINWDGVPDSFSSPNALPANFFNVNSPRGAVFSTPGSGFQVSANAGGPAPVNFGNIDPSYTNTFAPFSPQRLFTPIGSNIMDVTFFVAGTAIAAVTSAFGAIFTDVDVANTTSMQFFDRANVSLGTFFVPAVPGGNQSISFLGVSFANADIARVRITLGNAALGAGVVDNNGTLDLVVMDDFLYAEPVGAVIVPDAGSTVVFLGLALAGLLVLQRAANRRRPA